MVKNQTTPKWKKRNLLLRVMKRLHRFPVKINSSLYLEQTKPWKLEDVHHIAECSTRDGKTWNARRALFVKFEF